MGFENENRAEVPTEETLKSKVEMTAVSRAKYSRDYCEKTGKSVDTFVQELAGEPFRISIDQNDATSFALGICELQKTLGFPLDFSAVGCDGKLGPYTYKKFAEARLVSTDKKELEQLRKTMTNPFETKLKMPEVLAPLQESPLSQTLYFGDSLMVGVLGQTPGTYRTKNYERVVTRHGKEKHEKGGPAISGQQTSAMLEAMNKALENNEIYGVIKSVVLGGVNDLASMVAPSKIIANLEAMYKKLSEKGVQVLACTIPPWDIKAFLQRYKEDGREQRWGPYKLSEEQLIARQTEVNTWIRSQDGKSGVHVVDLENAVGSNPKAFQRSKDGLHFTPSGYAALSSYIQKNGGISDARVT